ncbi:PREDICTED: uncharacterized protein LOC100640743 [Amphimedon queenslandica]|uniref:Uncharacterized protein n=1 Tax=Amphimedon queenslandica TaxID=400682 RepID=A0A1X7V6M9_AMPQE|nr:PREDICTED: uncharacterized protein LOC100640743 [Amphimedon queenslandica]|eukprot:XP_003385434.2 PREDICTED: uncharacterized protein LOC100640743 [Amphimedon queenslandica]
MLQFLLRRIPVLCDSTKSSLTYRCSYLPLVTAGYNIQAKMSSTSTSSCLVTFVTCPSMEVARDLSRNILRSRLAACVNIIPQITSIYEWEGELQEDSEFLMVVKTSKDQISSLTSFIEQNHPYDVPEVISTEINHGSKKYLDWVMSSTKMQQEN